MKAKIKNALVCIAKLLLFVCLFMSIYNYTKEVFYNKYACEALNIITEQPNGTYDVILAGSSHMQYAIQPAQLFGEYGIAACNVSTSAQSVPTTYHVIKEMIRRHDPELVVVDLFLIYSEQLYESKARVHQALDHFPLTFSKMAAIEDLVHEDKAEFYLPYLLYHGRWKDATENDYQFRKQTNEKYQMLSGVTSYENDFVPLPVTETAELPQVSHAYLQKIVDLCKDTDTQLLFTVIPYRADVDNNDTSALLQQRLYNTVESYAQQWGVGYFNGLHHLDEMDFDFKTDMCEYSHLNTSGTQKISSYYGELFTKTYPLPDRSGDPSYADWYEDYDEYLSKFQ